MTTTLRTERLELRLAHADEAELVAAFYERNRVHLKPWEPTRDPAFFTADHWRTELAKFADDQARGTHLRTFVFEEGRVIGVVNVNNVVRGAFQSCHLGFSIDAERQGRGLMREAVARMIEHAFDERGLRLHRIEATYQPHNTRSGGLLKALGFVPQGFARDYLFLDGAWRDSIITAKLNERFTFT